MQTLELISKFKTRRENQDHFIRRIFAEWEDLKDYRLDMDQVMKIKDRQIATLENELKEKQKIQPSSF